MTTLLATFIIALSLSLIATPLAGKMGTRLGAIDMPRERKVHTTPIPRIGGLAIFVSFLLTIIIVSFFNTDVSHLVVVDRQNVSLLLGAIIVGGVGLLDDFRSIDYKIKFVIQIIGISMAFWGGVQISSFGSLNVTIKSIWLSYFITVFWFLLFINAINLIDGLDGLAAGVCFFTGCVMVILSIVGNNFFIAILFTSLCGSTLGFLRYNFNPASIFMGDGGSYFLGYTIAGLSIIGSYKSSVSATIMIPLLVLGIPVFDTILSPIRRFVLGRKIFQPDKGHIHHRLIEMGLSTKKVVLIAYGVTLLLCALAIFFVNVQNEFASLLLVILGFSMFLSVKKLGYLEYFTYDKIIGWLRDVTDTTGFSRERRSFLSLQIDIDKSRNMEEMWENTSRILEALELDYAELHLNNALKDSSLKEQSKIINELGNRMEPQKVRLNNASISMEKNTPEWSWRHKHFDQKNELCNRSILRLELPLLEADGTNFGTLILLKNLENNGLDHYFFRRVESLRRSLKRTITGLK